LKPKVNWPIGGKSAYKSECHSKRKIERRKTKVKFTGQLYLQTWAFQMDGKRTENGKACGRKLGRIPHTPPKPVLAFARNAADKNR
jgi:hypothetical protein